MCLNMAFDALICTMLQSTFCIMCSICSCEFWFWFLFCFAFSLCFTIAILFFWAGKRGTIDKSLFHQLFIVISISFCTRGEREWWFSISSNENKWLIWNLSEYPVGKWNVVDVALINNTGYIHCPLQFVYVCVCCIRLDIQQMHIYYTAQPFRNPYMTCNSG